MKLEDYAIVDQADGRAVYDCECCLGVVPTGTSDEGVALWLAGFDVGRRDGEWLGRLKLQQEFRRLMTVTA